MVVYVRLTADYKVESDSVAGLDDACETLMHAVGEAGEFIEAEYRKMGYIK
jgi:hypothetical protein